MAIYYNQQKYDSLREEFSFFRFQRYDYSIENQMLSVKFYFSLDDKYFFCPAFDIPARDFYKWDNISREQLDTLIFNIGMIELVSYWKLACPKDVFIAPHYLNEDQIKWWKKLYFNGLGEFFYLNKISTDVNEFMNIIVESDVPCKMIDVSLKENTMVPIGGGKDSTVTIELLKNKMPLIPFIINPRGATIDTVITAGYTMEQTAVINRTLDATMLKMNNEGFLNGHTPFSALLAFYSILVAFATDSKYIALSNESSANESTVPDTEINHQYSKSIAFENDFREYIRKYVSDEVQYFSFLRPITELQIACLFAGFERYHEVFKSCNVGSKTNSWCCKCPKCLFTWIILSPFLSHERLVEIFGNDVINDKDLLPILAQLKGEAEVKPFECVGTVEEVNACLESRGSGVESQESELGVLLQMYDENNNLPTIFENILKSHLS